MGHQRYSTEEIAVRGREIYEKRLRHQLEPGNTGKFLVIDIETGEYEPMKMAMPRRNAPVTSGPTVRGMECGSDIGPGGNSAWEG